jgi:hypothetical protein
MKQTIDYKKLIPYIENLILELKEKKIDEKLINELADILILIKQEQKKGE